MTIEVGGAIPDMSLFKATEDGPQAVRTSEFFAGRKVVLFAVPGAFTPTCSARHLPPYLEQREAFRARGVDEIACLAVNDPFVLQAWAESQAAGEGVTMLSDGAGLLTRALGLDIDLSERGLGVRSRRYAMVVEDGRVTHLAVEPGPGVGVSGAEAVLETLG